MLFQPEPMHRTRGLEKWRAQRTSTSIEVNTSRWRILFMSDQPEPTMVELFQYNHWANQELMAICMGLSDEMMVASNPGQPYGSIRETFAHILKAEISFLKRIHGIYPEPDFRWEDNPGLSQMAAYEATLNNALLDTLRMSQQHRMCMKQDG